MQFEHDWTEEHGVLFQGQESWTLGWSLVQFTLTDLGSAPWLYSWEAPWGWGPGVLSESRWWWGNTCAHC